MSDFWERQQRTELAEMAGIQPNHLSEILHRKRGVGKDLARKLYKTSELVLGYAIPFEAWLFNKTTKHPGFFEDPIT